VTVRPAWADWSPAGAEAPWTVGVEEEVMLLDPSGWALASRSDEVLTALPDDVLANVRAETHGSALELATDPHRHVGSATAQLRRLRAQLAAVLEPLGLRAAVAGTHPFTLWEDVEVSPGARYQFLYASMRELARREPTFGLHVHVAVPGPERAVRALNRLRAHLPVLLALSGNSPFWQGRDTGLCSMRTPLFQAFPRVGIPRAFADYPDYVEAIDICCCAATPSQSRLSCGGTYGCSRASARSSCGSWTRRRASATPPRWRRSCNASCAWRRSTGTPARRSRGRPRCSRRTASSPRAMA
jgi:carboxylate-amine ligase